MQAVSEGIIEQFATQFASGRKGFPLKDIGRYFQQYQPSVPLEPGEAGITKPAFFSLCVHRLSAADQWLALLDLCNNPPSFGPPMPDDIARSALRRLLFQVRGLSPMSDKISSITLRGVRENWCKIASRMPGAPASAITAARTLLESTCKTILNERGEMPDNSGDLGRLVKQTRKAVGIDDLTAEDAIKQVIGGVTSIVNGVAAASNVGGDRHGKIGGTAVNDVSFAELVINTCGTIVVFLVQRHLLSGSSPRD